MSNIVISQVYGSGGLSGATYRNDFIELFNRGSTPVNLNGWKLQYASATGTTWTNTTTLTDVNLQPGQYYLIQENSSGANGVILPTADDVTGAIDLSGTSGKVKLVNASGTQMDFVGYGATSGTPPSTLPYEGTGAAPGLSKTTAALRKEGGLMDTDNNAADFTTGAPNPHNSSQFERRPTATDKTFSLAEDHTYTFSEADFGYQDVDGNLLASVKITGLPWRGGI